jgi:sugar lactone lactonase YvrE
MIALSAVLCAVAALGFLPQEETEEAVEAPPVLEVVAELQQAPGNVTVTPGGRIILSLHQHYSPEMRVAELLGEGTLRPFPNAEWNEAGATERATFDSVLGIQSDGRSVVWMLDNGLRGGSVPKLVAWDVNTNTLHKLIYLPPPVTRGDSFVNDLAVDLDHGAIYVADPAGEHSALIVVDIHTGHARRVLEGHPSVVPEDSDLVIEGKPVEIRRADGTMFRPRIGVNPIALDAKNEWLYYGPMHGRAIYRVRTADLLDPKSTLLTLSTKVEKFAKKPFSDGSSVDNAGNVYISDVGSNAIGTISPEGKYEILFQDDKLLSWPDSFSFGPGGMLYLVANQLHRGPVLNAGTDRSQPPYYVLKFKAPAAGVIGR